jgi:phosphoribosylaminoimidazole carboxylase (NCAIR synthetase)
MNILRLLCTDVHSESASRLAVELYNQLGYKVYRSDAVKPNRQHIRYGDQRDKLTQYNFFRKNGLNFPMFTESKREAGETIKRLGVSFLCRITLKGQEGRGIVIADKPEQLVDAPVYVQYLEKDKEYRVNLFKGSVVNVREKLKKRNFAPPEEGYEPRIRNVANGYVYCIPKDPVPPEILATAIAATRVTDSDIIGVDVAYNSKTKQHFLLEVNSAPAIEGGSVKAYADAIIKHYGD